MIQNTHLIDTLNKAQLPPSPPDYLKNLALFEGLYREAIAPGALPLKDPLEGIETDIRLSRRIRNVLNELAETTGESSVDRFEKALKSTI